MTNKQLDTPASAATASDAIERTIRTAVQGVGVTVFVGVVDAISRIVVTPDNVFTGAYWGQVGGTAAVAALTAVFSWIHAHVQPPK